MRKLTRFFIAILGLGVGAGLLYLILWGLESLQLFNINTALTPTTIVIIYCAAALVGAFLLFLASKRIISFFSRIEKGLFEMPINDMIFGIIGLIIGLIISFFVTQLFTTIPIPVLPTILSVIVYIFLSYMGWTIAVKRRSEISASEGIFRKLSRDRSEEKADRKEKGLLKDKDAVLSRPKVLDTSVIIDGRIFDICKTGFVEGTLVIPGFVLEELRHIADSADGLKRNRGRRGLDVLNRIRKELDIKVRIVEKDYPDLQEVDTKLLRMAKELGGLVVTNDYNLNKVAEVSNVSVLNVNELANAVKPIVMPGEEMEVQIIKDGKESGQGVGYLDDGTMIVVEGGKRHMGEEHVVTVTSVLQTAAGRMIFAKLK